MLTRATDPASTVVRAFLAGDEPALASIYARWSPQVYSLALRSLGVVAAAEEVTQEVFVEAWASRLTFDPERTTLPAWLFGIAGTAIADRHRTRGHRAPLPHR